MKRKNQKEIICCILFFLVLYAFWAADLLCADRMYSDWEKRMLAQKPQLKWSSVLDGSYESEYEDWMTDQFPGRDWWVGVKTRCEILLGKKEIQGIYLGKDGYMFAESEAAADWDKIENQMKEQFGAGNVSRIRAPHAGAVYADKVPDGIAFGYAEDTVFRNLYEHRSEYIYFRTDHHWTMLGAYYAYEIWARERGFEPLTLNELSVHTLKNDFLGTHYGKIHYSEISDLLEAYEPEIICETVYDLGGSDVTGLYQEQLLDTEDAYRYFLDGNHAVVQIETGHEGGHLAVLKDSFANCLIPFLTAHYEKITVIDPRYFRADIGTWLSEQEITEVLLVEQDTVKVR